MTDQEMAKLVAKLNAREEQERSNAERSIIDLCLVLSSMKIATVVAHYDGSGDTGQIEYVEYFDSNGTKFNDKEVPEPTNEAFCNIVYDLLPGTFNNEGCFGTANLHVDKRVLHFDHEDRIESTEHSDHYFGDGDLSELEKE